VSPVRAKIHEGNVKVRNNRSEVLFMFFRE
jgi:hypothetical protein